MNKYTPQVAGPVESFRAAFDRLCDSLTSNDIGISKEAKEQIWLFFEDNYTTVTMSMFGWKECFESERAMKLKAMDVIADITSIVTNKE